MSRERTPGEDEVCARCGLHHRAEDPNCPAQLIGRTLGGRFHVVRLVGAGGTASVFKAQNVAIGRFVALKVLHPHLRGDTAAVERFVREGRTMSRVRHTGVVDVLDLVTTEDGAPMLVFEYVRARSLSAEIRRSGPMPFARAIDVAGQLLATLAAVHARGFVHRDVKPANILLGVDARQREQVKLADFGLAVDARSPRGGAARSAVTPPGRVLATPRYLAPELLRGGDSHDLRVDLYSAGLVLYEMLAGRPAYGATDLDELADAILRSRPPSILAARPDLPPEIDAVITHALARRPGERFATAYAFLEALRPFGADSDVIDAEPTDTGLLEVPRAVVSLPFPRSLRPAPSAPSHRHSIFPRPDADDPATDTYLSLRAAAAANEGSDPEEADGASGPQRIGAVAPGAVAPIPRARTRTPATEPLPEAPHGRVRGAIPALLVSVLRAHFGDASIDDVIATLPEATRGQYLGPIGADEWVGGVPGATLLEAADGILGRGDGALCIAFGRVAARSLLRKAHGEMLAQATPESALIEAGSLWRHYFEIGELRVPSVGRGYGKLDLRAYVPRRSTCLSVQGFVEVLLELAGGRDVEVVSPTCRALGDLTCTFDATWMT